MDGFITVSIESDRVLVEVDESSPDVDTIAITVTVGGDTADNTCDGGKTCSVNLPDAAGEGILIVSVDYGCYTSRITENFEIGERIYMC